MVTGFSGRMDPESPPMRLMLGLDRGEGQTKWDGKKLTEHKHATKVVGAHPTHGSSTPTERPEPTCGCSPLRPTFQIRASMRSSI